jgi:hypothetical protein
MVSMSLCWAGWGNLYAMRESVLVRMPEPHRFPTPWSVEEQTTCFIVRDREGRALAHLYFDDEPQVRSPASLPSYDEARNSATDIAASSVGSKQRHNIIEQLLILNNGHR